jgi:hypothetical protein
MHRLTRFPWYVIFISIYPALFYWAFNATEMSSINGFKLVVYSLLIGLICWTVFLVLFRNLVKASLATFFSLLLFWSYGHLHNYLVTIHPLIFRHAVHVSVWAALFPIGFGWLFKKNPDGAKLASILNLVTAFLLVYPITQVVPRVIEERRVTQQSDSQTILASIEGIDPVDLASPPDVYLIILDTYTRHDVLRDDLSFDNSGFLTQLEGLGFYIARCSQSNYVHTRLSLSSSMNYRYLHDIYPTDPTSNTSPSLIKRSAVQRIFENWGYKIVAFETGHSRTELTDADIYLTRGFGLLKLTEFDLSFLETSFLQSFMKKSIIQSDQMMAAEYRARSLFVLDKLRDSVHIKGPKFVFAHVLLPHPPFVFGPNGEPVYLDYPNEDPVLNKEIYLQGIRYQTSYINNRIYDIIQSIIAESEQPPIIILQGDHGIYIGKPQQTKILNAMYLPGGEEDLYSRISPVNTFRYIFNHYFGQHMEMEVDVARWASVKTPQKFEIIPNDCQPDGQTSSP